MVIDYPKGKKLQLWFQDTKKFDGIAIYVDGKLVRQVSDQDLHKIEVPPPRTDVTAVVLHFGGNDGGESALVDVTSPTHQEPLDRQSGLRHSYLLRKV